MNSVWRFEVRLIDRGLLVKYMEFRGFSCESLAQKVGCSKATIGHLRSGHIRGVRKGAWAVAIEHELNVPPGSLFVAHVSRVSDNAA